MTSCDPIAPNGFIVYAELYTWRDGQYIKGSLQRLPIGATSAYQTTLLPSIDNPVAVEFYHIDDLNGFIYWSDPGAEYIGRVGFDGSGSVTIVNHVRTDSLAVDWISGNLYWIGYDVVTNNLGEVIRGNFSISVSRLNGSYQKKLISSGLGSLLSLAVLPKEGYVVMVTVNVVCVLSGISPGILLLLNPYLLMHNSH